MADSIEPLINSVTPTATGTLTGSPLPTLDRRDFAIVLRMDTTAGSGADTLDIFIEESSDIDFNNPENIRTVALQNPSTSVIATQLTQVTGGVSLPAATDTATVLRQKWLLPDSNYDRFLRARYIIAGTPANLGSIRLDLLSNRKI